MAKPLGKTWGLHQADEDHFPKLSKHKGNLTESLDHAFGQQEGRRTCGDHGVPTQYVLPGKASPRPSTLEKMPACDQEVGVWLEMV